MIVYIYIYIFVGFFFLLYKNRIYFKLELNILSRYPGDSGTFGRQLPDRSPVHARDQYRANLVTVCTILYVQKES